MNILVIGGCGFIGNSLAKRLSARKHLVSVIDIKEPRIINSLSDGVEYHIADAASDKCKEIFETEYFDTVVYAAGPSFGRKDADYEQDLKALVNILKLSNKFSVKKFIYISTAFLNSYLPMLEKASAREYSGIETYCTYKVRGEYYCSTYSKYSNLRVSIIRLPIVYGPGQDTYGEGGMILSAFKNNKADEHSKMLVYGSNLEFSYINDVSKKLYDLINSEKTGIFEYIGIDIKDDVLISKIQVMLGNNKIEAIYSNEIDMRHSDRIEPLNTYEENTSLDYGLYRTLEWFLNEKDCGLEIAIDEQKLNSKDKESTKVLQNKLFKYSHMELEYLVSQKLGVASKVFKVILVTAKALCALLNFKLKTIETKLMNFREKCICSLSKECNSIMRKAKIWLPWTETFILSFLSIWFSTKMKFLLDLRLVCIIIIGLKYGVVYSITAACICITFVFFSFINQYAIITRMNVLETAIIYLFVSIISGLTMTSKNIENIKIKESYSMLEQLYQRVRKELSDKRKAVSIMAEQIRTSESNFGDILLTIRRINKHTINEILKGIPEIVFELTGLKDIELYMASDEEDKVYILHSENSNCNIYERRKSFVFSEKGNVWEGLKNGDVYINVTHDSNLPDVIIPILNYNTRKIEGIIIINGVPFMNFNVNTEYMLNFIGEILSSRFSNSSREVTGLY